MRRRLFVSLFESLLFIYIITAIENCALPHSTSVGKSINHTRGCCNSYFRLKFKHTLFVHNLHFSSLIVSKCCRVHGNINVVHCVNLKMIGKYRNKWRTVEVSWDLSRTWVSYEYSVLHQLAASQQIRWTVSGLKFQTISADIDMRCLAMGATANTSQTHPSHDHPLKSEWIHIPGYF